MSVQWQRDVPRRDQRNHGRVLRTALLWLVVLCVSAHSARAQFTRFQNFTDEQGLGNLGVDALVQDRDGYILLGTEAGLYRYDGASVAPYSAGLPSVAWIQQMVADDSGRIWVVTSAGLYVRSRTTFTPVDIGSASTTLMSPHLLAVTDGAIILDANGTLLRATVGSDAVGTFSPLFDAAMLRAMPELAHARFVVADGDGGLLIGCGVAICRASAGRVSLLGQAVGLSPDAWQVARRAADGTIWARSLKHIAWRRPGQASFSVVTLPRWDHGPQAMQAGEHTSYVANPERLELLDDRNGGVLTQGGGGLADWNGKAWDVHSHHASGLPADRIQSLLVDREGSLWVGSFGTGAYRSIGMHIWEHWTADDGLPSNIVWSMARLPNGQLWVATDAGTVATNGRSGGLPTDTNYVTKATRGGRLWLAPVGSSLIRRDPARGVDDRFASIGKTIASELGPDNRLWLGSANGLFEIADADAPASAIHPDRVFAHATTSVTTDPAGMLWALSPDGAFRRDAAGRFDLVLPASS